MCKFKKGDLIYIQSKNFLGLIVSEPYREGPKELYTVDVFYVKYMYPSSTNRTQTIWETSSIWDLSVILNSIQDS